MQLDRLFLVYRSSYPFGLRPLLAQTHSRLDESLSERARIVGDLHDLRLQGFLSASMQLHVAVDQLPGNSPVKLRLSRVLEMMGNAIEGARNVIRGLRSPGKNCHDLEQAFSRIPQELAIEKHIDFRLIVLGSDRQLRPLVFDEVYRIGREGLVNAFRHSRANRIEVEIEYAAKRFRLIVRDNGCGIDPQVVYSGRDGHLGFAGMREGAERIDARLRIWSRVAAGTELEVSVPSYIAFEPQSPSAFLAHPQTVRNQRQ
jgi:signal transduction histidine kinase